MGHDLNFWRYRIESTGDTPARTDADHLAVYQRLCEERSEGLEELEALPLEAIRHRLDPQVGEHGTRFEAPTGP
jgi:hypothetical protein